MFVTKSAVRLLKCTYPVIHHSLCSLPRRRSVLRASLCNVVQCCMLLKDSVFAQWINNFKCSLKTSVSLVLATELLTELSLPLQPAWKELKGKWGRGVQARPSSCTPLNSHTQNETVPPSSFPFNVCHAGYIHCVPINTVKAPVLSKTIKNQSCFAFPSMDSFDILLLEFEYSWTSRYGHLSITDSFTVPTKFSYIFFNKTSIIWTLSNTDNGH